MKETFLSRLLENFNEDKLLELERFAEYKGHQGPVLRGIQAWRGPQKGKFSMEEFWKMSVTDVSQEFSKKRLQKLCFRIKELALEYLATKKATGESITRDMNAFRFISEAGWDSELPGMHRRLTKLLGGMPDQGRIYAHHVELAEAEQAFQIRSANTSTLQALEKGWEGVKSMFLAKGLRYENLHLDLLLQQEERPAKEKQDLRLFNREWLEEMALEAYPLIQSHHAIHQMLSQPGSNKKFVQARKVLEGQIAKEVIGKEDLKELLQLLLNHAIRRCRRGDEAWKTATELQLRLIGIVEGEIRARELKNAISSLVMYKDVKAAREVFERFKDRIQGDESGHARTYNEGVVLYYEGRFDNARNKFADVLYSTQDNYLKADGRIYWWRAQIDGVFGGESYDEEHLLYRSQNVRKYFARTPDLPESMRSFYRDYFNVMRKIYKAIGLKGGKRKSLISRIKQEVDHLEEHPLKNWLNEKVEALEK